MTGFKYIRDQYNKTLEGLAEQLGVSKQVVYMWENGKKPIPQKRADQLSNMLGIPQKYFYIEEVSERDQLEIKSYRLGKELNESTIAFQDRVPSSIEKQFDFNTAALKMNDLFMKQKSIIEDYKPTFSEPSLSEREYNFRDKEFLYRIRMIKILDRFTDILKGNNHFEILFQIMRAMELFYDVNVKKNQMSGKSSSPMLFGMVYDDEILVQKLVEVLKEYQKSNENYKEDD
jgi:transcriptional regulator with XRE-family HTH domain